jgi:hypothetical protein
VVRPRPAEADWEGANTRAEPIFAGMLITREIEDQGDDADQPEADEDGGQPAPLLHYSWVVRLETGMMIFAKYPAGLMLTLGSAACYLDGSPPQ